MALVLLPRWLVGLTLAAAPFPLTTPLSFLPLIAEGRPTPPAFQMNLHLFQIFVSLRTKHKRERQEWLAPLKRPYPVQAREQTYQEGASGGGSSRLAALRQLDVNPM